MKAFPSGDKDKRGVFVGRAEGEGRMGELGGSGSNSSTLLGWGSDVGE